MSKIAKKTNPIKFVIFDCDNILINSDTILISILLDTIENQGKNLEPDLAINYFGGKSLKSCIPILEEICNTKFCESYLEGCLESEINTGLESNPGVKKFINSLQVPYCLVTKLNYDVVIKNLILTELHPLFKEDQILADIKNSYGTTALQITSSKGFSPFETLIIKDRPDDLINMEQHGFTMAAIAHLPNVETNLNTLFYEDINELYELVEIG